MFHFTDISFPIRADEYRLLQEKTGWDYCTEILPNGISEDFQSIWLQ